MPQDWGPVVYSGSATTNTFPVDDTAICKPALKASRKDCISEVCTAGTLPVPLNPACCPGHGQSGPVNLGRMRDYHQQLWQGQPLAKKTSARTQTLRMATAFMT